MGYIVCTKGQKIAEIMHPTADFVTVELNRIQCLEAREVIVRTISAQGESQDSPVATIPHSILVPQPHGHHHLQSHPPPYPQPYPMSHPQPHIQPHTVQSHHSHSQPTHPQIHPPPSSYPINKPKLPPSARDPHAKESEMGRRFGQPWEPRPRAPSPVPPPSQRGHMLEPPHIDGRRSPSPQRILPQPQGVPIPNTVARAMARQAAQRSAPNTRVERRNVFSERGNALHSLNSDEEEDGYDSPHARRRGASVDEFLRGSELGRHHHHYSHNDEYYTESSRGSDLSDIMEEDEEELYSEMQLEEGRRRSINSHNTLKAYYRRQDLGVERDSWDLQREVVRQRSLRSQKRLHSIPEVAEEDPDTGVEVIGQRLRFEEAHPGSPGRTPHPYHHDSRESNLSPSKSVRRLQRQRSSPRYSSIEERAPCWSSSSSRQTSKSPDSGLDCGSEEEGYFGYRGGYLSYTGGSPLRVGSGTTMRVIHSEGPVERRALAAGRKRTLTRQSSIEDDFLDAMQERRSMRESYYHYHYHPHHHQPQRRFRSEGRLSEVGRTYHRNIRAYSVARLNRAMDEPLILGSSPPMGRSDRLDYSGRRTSHGCPPAQRRPMMVPSIEITMENNSEGSEGNLSPIKDEVYFTNVAHRRKSPSQRTEHRYDGYGGRERRSPDFYEGSELEDLSRIFVAMFDYDPLSMSPNPDAAVEELPFKEGQVIKVFGQKDTDGFYRAEICGRRGLVPCNMVSEIQADDEEMMDQLLKQGFLPLNTPIEKLERNKRNVRQQQVSTRRMVALYDYDPRESSPNVDVETRYGGSLQSEEVSVDGLKKRVALDLLQAELTFCAGDVITVFGEIDEDGFYYVSGSHTSHHLLHPKADVCQSYVDSALTTKLDTLGELNGHKGLVPSNFLEEVPDDVEVYLSNPQSRHPQEHPSRTKSKRVPMEKQPLPEEVPPVQCIDTLRGQVVQFGAKHDCSVEKDSVLSNSLTESYSQQQC
ncbi:hypothetical protein DNTS_028448 [Danionella cerebrum]|uniref:SH3 domain-containing protein n=1 Tax=Danionella cerebrum TaxID=2873325 RepID=A0A553MZR7_9TELE|nr:hypothetical protein DNTS_028448 [Danionella translucida]